MQCATINYKFWTFLCAHFSTFHIIEEQASMQANTYDNFVLMFRDCVWHFCYFSQKKNFIKINSIFLLFISQCYLDLWACRHKCYRIRGMIMRNISNYCFKEFIIFYIILMWNIFEYFSKRDYCIGCKLWPLNLKKKKLNLIFM